MFAALLVSQLAATVAFTFVMPFMPLYVEELGVRDPGAAAFWAGVLNSATAVTMLLAAPFWGRLADRFGPRLMLLRATLAGAVVVGLMGLVSDPWQLLALRFLQGGLTGTVAAATVLVSATSPANRVGARLGYLQMIIFLAAALGPFVGGVFVELAGVRASFAVTSGLLALSGVLVMIWVPEARPAEREEEDEGVTPLPFGRLMPGLLSLFVVYVALVSVVPIMPGFLSQLMEGDGQIARRTGELIAVGGLASALGSIFGGRLAGRWGTRRVILWALLLAGLTAIPQALVSSVAELWVLRIVSSVFLGIVIPVANLAIRDEAPPERQGAAFGFGASSVSTAHAVGPLGGGLLASAVGFAFPFLVPGVLLVGVAAVLWFTMSGGERKGSKPFQQPLPPHK